MRSDLEKMQEELSKFRLQLIGELAEMSAEIETLRRALLQKELLTEEELSALRASTGKKKGKLQDGFARRIGRPF